MFAGPRPAELHPFVELDGPRHTAPATPGDLLFHIRAESLDVCFELADRILEAMAGAVTVVDEVHGFRFFDNRDLLGFVDGTENPDGPLAVIATQIGDEDPDFAGWLLRARAEVPARHGGVELAVGRASRSG